VSGSLSFLPRYTPRPEPAYVSAAAACDHVVHLHDQEQFDPRSPAASPTNDGALFSEQALGLLNTFLDALLYNFLTKGHGTSLSQLRPAITEVLKSKLARDALASADEELHGLIGEADADMGTEEELTASQFGGRSGWAQDWHLEMAFKRMRLRVMVFIRLGDFDDEDEDRFLEDDDQFPINGTQPSQDMDFLASPAAVYLASVLEHVAEQALTVAGEAAYVRSKKQLNKRPISEDKELDDMDYDRVVVEEMDVEKIALNPTLGRLWRTWRKNYRSMHGASTPGSTGIPASPHYRARLGSLNEIAGPSTPTCEDVVHGRVLDRHLTPDEIPDGDVSEHDIAANIPLPMSDNDIDEIEILGVAIPLPMSENDVDEIEIIGVAMPLPMGDNDVNEIEVPGLAKEIFDDEMEDAQPDLSNFPPPHRPLSALCFRPLRNHSEETAHHRTRPRSRSVPSHPRLPDLSLSAPPAKSAFKSARTSTFEDFYDAVDRPYTSPEEERYGPELDEKVGEKDDARVNAGVVAGAITGAVALVGSAFASIAAIGHGRHESPEETPKRVDPEADPTTPFAFEMVPKETEAQATGEHGIRHVVETKLNPEKGLTEQPALVEDSGASNQTHKDIGLHNTGGHGVEPVEMPVLGPQKRPTSQLQAPLEDSDLRTPKSANAFESGKAQIPSENEKPHEIQALLNAPRSQLENMRPSSLSEKAMVPAPLQLSKHDRTVLAELNGVDEEEDMDAIGVAKTSNVPIHSHSSSPTPDQSRAYHLPSNQGSSTLVGFQGRNESPPPQQTNRNAKSNRDRSLVGADEHILPRENSGSKHNTGPSPLRAVIKANKPPYQNGLNENLEEAQDIPHAVPFYHRPVDDEALKQEQASNRAFKDNNSKLPSPIETNLVDGMARPPSASHSTGGRSTTSSSTGHSAKGSSSSSVMPRNLDKRPSDESKRRDFDSLLKNEETVKYTLTPEDLRESDVSLSAYETPSQSFRQDFTNLPKLHGSPSSNNRNSALGAGGERSPRIVSTSSSPNNPSSPRVANFPNKPNSPRVAKFPKNSNSPKKAAPRTSDARKSIPSRPLTSRPDPMNTNTRKSGFMPREPRVMTDDTRDFADFVRSTRPTSEQPVTPIVDPTSHSELKASADAGTSARPGSTQPQIPRSASRSNMVPREPDVKGGGSSDLIDFIRQGPPKAHLNDQHRIARTVAPFRSPMDSEDLSPIGNYGDINSGASIRTNSLHSNSRQSVAPTVNSNTGLLPSQNGNTAQRPSQSSLSAPSPQIVRKTRRVKDPYAIDSDDDDDLLTALPNGRSKQAKDESLEEFLRSTEPPKSNAPAPIKAPANGLNGHRPHTNGHTNGTSTSSAHANGTRPQSRSSVNTSQPTAAPPVRAPGASMTASPAPRLPVKQKWEARAAGATRNGFGGNGFFYSTNDMADFLRSSGPPHMDSPNPEVSLSKKPSRSGRKFWQRA